MNYTLHFVDNRVEAQDIVQNSIVKLWETYPNSVEDYPRLVFTIIRNNCLNYLRRTRFERGVCDIGTPTAGEILYNMDFRLDSGSEPYLYRELETEINQVLDTLPERCREVFEMSRFEQLKNREIAQKLGISVSAVEQHITRALKAFASALADYHSAGFVIFVISLFS